MEMRGRDELEAPPHNLHMPGNSNVVIISFRNLG
jgi:hypothetical protein